MKSTTPNIGSDTLQKTRTASSPLRSRSPGQRAFASIVIIGLVALVGGVVGGFAIGHKTSGKPTSEGKAVAKLQGKLDAAAVGIDAENAKQVKAGQQLAATTTAALAAAGPEAKADPAVQLASKAAAKADAALSLGAGPLTPEQVAWVTKLVADATSGEAKRTALAEAALTAKDSDLQRSVEREAKLTTRIGELEGDKRVADQTLIEHDGAASAFRATVMLWVYGLVGAYVVINYLLPLLAKSFPALGGIATAAHAVWSGLWAKTLAESKSLARDTSGALHSVMAIAETGNAKTAAAIKTEAATWITPSDGTAVRYAQALKDANAV